MKFHEIRFPGRFPTWLWSSFCIICSTFSMAPMSFWLCGGRRHSLQSSQSQNSQNQETLTRGLKGQIYRKAWITRPNMIFHCTSSGDAIRGWSKSRFLVLEKHVSWAWNQLWLRLGYGNIHSIDGHGGSWWFSVIFQNLPELKIMELKCIWETPKKNRRKMATRQNYTESFYMYVLMISNDF